MRYLLLITFAILLPGVELSFGQVISDKSEIERLEKGQYAFAKGEIQVTFKDSVSKGFVKNQLHSLGYEVLHLNINRQSAFIRNEPEMKKLVLLENNPDVYSIDITQRTISEDAIQRMFERDSISIEDQEKVRKRFELLAEREIIRVYFNFNVDQEKAKKILQAHSGIEFRMNMATPKTAHIKTKVGEENNAMKSLKRLIYVKNTAYVGIINNEE
jgi:hypothetical protein